MTAVRADFTLTSPVVSSARVLQMASMFDVPVEQKSSLRIEADLPLDDRSWQVGLIVGPSGSGKSSLARHLWPGRVDASQSWSPDASLMDNFPPGMGIKEVVGLLTAVGLGSPPTWMRPFGTLSNGEAFRASMARTLAEMEGLVVVDEFTSVVDRQVAQVASHAVQKTVRRSGRQMVAVTCHYDVTDWLQPDWIYDMAAKIFSWRSVQPHPRISLAVHPADRTLWPLFARHHYLSGDLHKSAHCFSAWIGEELVAFTSYLHFPHAGTKNIKMGHRLVVFPDYQGLGIGGRLDDWLGQHLYDQGFRYRNVVSHPAMIRYYSASPRWRATSKIRKYLSSGPTAGPGRKKYQLSSRSLSVHSFEYVPPRKAAA